jgi:hypothetical protein
MGRVSISLQRVQTEIDHRTIALSQQAIRCGPAVDRDGPALALTHLEEGKKGVFEIGGAVSVHQVEAIA